jgi:hypothetical protein
VERFVLDALTIDAALPPDICAFDDCHRLQEKPIHFTIGALALWLARVTFSA